MTEQTQIFRVTHPFHPLNGQEFTLIDQRKAWGEDRVYFYDSAGTLRHLPSGWTSVSTEDAPAALSAPRAHFRTVDLLQLVALIVRQREVQPLPGRTKRRHRVSSK
ncbi:MAG: DUF5372 family protein [Steroidobacteraceae bacterium]